MGSYNLYTSRTTELYRMKASDHPQDNHASHLPEETKDLSSDPSLTKGFVAAGSFAGSGAMTSPGASPLGISSGSLV